MVASVVFHINRINVKFDGAALSQQEQYIFAASKATIHSEVLKNSYVMGLLFLIKPVVLRRRIRICKS